MRQGVDNWHNGSVEPAVGTSNSTHKVVYFNRIVHTASHCADLFSQLRVIFWQSIIAGNRDRVKLLAQVHLLRQAINQAGFGRNLDLLAFVCLGLLLLYLGGNDLGLCDKLDDTSQHEHLLITARRLATPQRKMWAKMWHNGQCEVKHLRCCTHLKNAIANVLCHLKEAVFGQLLATSDTEATRLLRHVEVAFVPGALHRAFKLRRDGLGL